LLQIAMSSSLQFGYAAYKHFRRVYWRTLALRNAAERVTVKRPYNGGLIYSG